MEQEGRSSPTDELETLFAQASAETMFYSTWGAYHKSEAYQKIIDQGELVLPSLLQAIQKESTGDEEQSLWWWPLCAVGIIAQNIGKPFEVPQESVADGKAVAFSYDEVRDAVLTWGHEEGYLSPELEKTE